MRHHLFTAICGSIFGVAVKMTYGSIVNFCLHTFVGAK